MDVGKKGRVQLPKIYEQRKGIANPKICQVVGLKTPFFFMWDANQSLFIDLRNRKLN